MPDAHISGEANVIAAMALLLADRTREAVEAAAGATGSEPAALSALHEFASAKPIEVLAGALGISHSRAVRVIDGLAARGLARRRRARDDARVVHVELTSAGRAAARRVLAARAEAAHATLASLTGPERTIMAAAAGNILADATTGRSVARRICRLCDAHACGHDEGRCPVTLAADRAERAQA